jgi:flavin reductase (DIM6/NTAB) family NADH-FMN oxidoreductase RutF
MTADAFAHICSTLDFPMTVVTAYDGNERSGCLVGFHAQCSIAPRRWLVCVSKTNHTFGVASRARRLIVHVLRNDQHALAELFGGETEDAIAPATKFERCAWHAAADGTPILDGCDWFAGTILERVDLGDHVGHLIEITGAGHEHPDAPQFGFQAARDIHPGHPP